MSRRTFCNMLLLLSLVLASAQACLSRNVVVRPLPEWYDQAKFGVMLHWGVYSVPSYGGDGASEWFWKHWKDYKQKPLIEFMEANYKPGFSYADFAAQFTAEFYDPDKWVDLIKSSGARYAVVTTKHHEGFCNWPTNVSFSWRSVDVGPNRDIIGDFVKSLRRRSNIKLGLYHSLYEWFNPLYLADKANNFTTNLFSMGKTIPELHELVNLYQPSLIWSDGEWEANANYWNSSSFINWLYTESPVKDEIVVNNRWGANGTGPQGDYKSFENTHEIIYKKNYKWENAIPIDRKSWGYRRDANMDDYLTTQEIIRLLVQAVSMGGNFLLNIGPTSDGSIPPMFEERLKQIGSWLSINGVAIYNTTLWYNQIDKSNNNVWYTTKPSDNTVYGILIQNWPESQILELSYPTPSDSTVITLVGYGTLQYSYNQSVLSIHLPYISPGSQLRYAWSFHMTNLQNSSH